MVSFRKAVNAEMNINFFNPTKSTVVPSISRTVLKENMDAKKISIAT